MSRTTPRVAAGAVTLVLALVAAVVPFTVSSSAATAPDYATTTSTTTTSATLAWTVYPHGHKVTGVYVGRNGTSTSSVGAWTSPLLKGTTGKQVFLKLRTGTAYTLSLQPVVDGKKAPVRYYKVTTKKPAPVVKPTPSPSPSPSPVQPSPTMPSPSETPTCPITPTDTPTETPTETPTVPEPSATPTTPEPTTTPDTHTLTDMEIGAAVGGNSDPAPLEAAAGVPLSLHRTYWGGGSMTSAIASAKADLAAGREPFMSFKVPGSADSSGSWTGAWQTAAAGGSDAWATDLAQRLSALGGPVKVAFFHEPEGDGSITAWTALQAHLAPIFDLPNIEFGVILTGWHEFSGTDPQYKLAALWPYGAPIDYFAVDTYQRYGTSDAGLKWTDLDPMFKQAEAFAHAQHVQWGLAETGITDEGWALARGKTWFTDVPLMLAAHDAAFMSYFDSSLNSKGSWVLTGAKLDAFAAALRLSRSE